MPNDNQPNDKVPETKAELSKVPETKSIFQVINKKLKEGELQILLQMEIDNDGDTRLTIFKSNKIIEVEPETDTEPKNPPKEA